MMNSRGLGLQTVFGLEYLEVSILTFTIGYSL